MAPKKKHSEGIALLSVYSDEDDEEMEDAEEEEEEEEEQRNQEESENRIQEDQVEETNFMDEERGRGGEDSRTPRLLDGGGASSAHATPRSLDNNEESSRPDWSNRMIGESEVADGERADDASRESCDTLLDQFLPPPPKEKCSEELQRKIDKFLSLKKMGKSFNAEVRNRKEYRNPDFLLHAFLMAPKKKHSEGIALLSVYSDEDDEEMEDAEEEDEEEEQRNREESENRIEEDQVEETSFMDEERGRGGEDSRTPRLLDGGGASSAHATPRSLDNNEESSRTDWSNRMIRRLM